MEKQERMADSVEDKKNDQIKKVLKHPASMVFIGFFGRNFELFGRRICFLL